MQRLLFLTNIPTPYQMDFFGELAKQAPFRAVFLWEREANRNWEIKQPEWMRVLNYKDAAEAWEKLGRMLDEFNPTAVVAGGYRLPLATSLRQYAGSRSISFFYWLEKPLPAGKMKAALRSLLWRLTLPRADGVLCIGSDAERAYSRLARRTFQLPYSILLSRYALRDQAPAQLPLKCLFVGQYIRRKGFPELLEAFAALSPQKATLSCAGSGEMAPLLKDYARRYQHIRDIGFISPGELPQRLAEHDLFVLPSRHDGWAVVVAEALAVGLPVIGTLHTGAFVDLVAANGCGRTCEVSADSIRQAVEYYIAHPEEVRRQGRRGRQMLEGSMAISENAAKRWLQWLAEA